MRKVELLSGAKAWAFSSSQYVQAAVKNVEDYLEKQDRWKMPNVAETPMVTAYCPELNVSLELRRDGHSTLHASDRQFALDG